MKALEQFVHTVNVTGGVVRYGDGNVAPAADQEWTDLGSVYMAACVELGIAPQVTNSRLHSAKDYIHE
jgi:hypothetical protein